MLHVQQHSNRKRGAVFFMRAGRNVLKIGKNRVRKMDRQLAVFRLRKRLEEEPELRASLPAEPEEPRPQECCGQACMPCVFDIYCDDLARWTRECKAILDGERFLILSSLFSSLNSATCT